MNKYIIILFFIAFALPSEGQYLKPESVKIELMDGGTMKAQLFGYTSEAVIIKEAYSDSVSSQTDTISYIRIEKIIVFKDPTWIYTVIGSPAGGIGGIVYGITNPSKFDGLYNVDCYPLIILDDLFSCFGVGAVCCFFSTGSVVGGLTGTIFDLVHFRRQNSIHANENKFKAFITKYRITELR